MTDFWSGREMVENQNIRMPFFQANRRQVSVTSSSSGSSAGTIGCSGKNRWGRCEMFRWCLQFSLLFCTCCQFFLFPCFPSQRSYADNAALGNTIQLLVARGGTSCSNHRAEQSCTGTLQAGSHWFWQWPHQTQQQQQLEHCCRDATEVSSGSRQFRTGKNSKQRVSERQR